MNPHILRMFKGTFSHDLDQLRITCVSKVPAYPRSKKMNRLYDQLLVVSLAYHAGNFENSWLC